MKRINSFLPPKSYCFRTITRDKRAYVQDPKFKLFIPTCVKYYPKYSAIDKNINNIQINHKEYSIELKYNWFSNA